MPKGFLMLRTSLWQVRDSLESLSLNEAPCSSPTSVCLTRHWPFDFQRPTDLFVARRAELRTGGACEGSEGKPFPEKGGARDQSAKINERKEVEANAEQFPYR